MDIGVRFGVRAVIFGLVGLTAIKYMKIRDAEHSFRPELTGDLYVIFSKG